MTKINAAQAAMDLTRIAAELEAARADLALLERLKSAVDREKRLTTEQGKAIAARDKALAADAKANEASYFAGISDVRVTQNPNTLGESLLRSSFTIEYTKPGWNMYDTVPAQHSVVGFGALPPAVLDYLIEKRPDLIPTEIKALVPDSPREAFRTYFLGIRRGYMSA